MKKTAIAVAHGDGIGPEIMEATLYLLSLSGAALEIHPVQIGEAVYLAGQPTGIAPQTWETLLHTEAFLKAPITTPQGGGYKSLNVTIRAALGLYANIRPCISFYPFVATKHPNMDVVIVRENEEDLYTGIEYQQTQDTCHALKIITRPGCERIIRYAFEYARRHKRKKVTCFTKDNILKRSDGLFHAIFDEIAKEYPDIQNEHWIIDIGAAKLADTPEAFDVIVLPNLYGDILSDVAAQIAGSVGLAGSANIGLGTAMFEAIHGSAPRRAGQDVANPSGLLLAAIMMLDHIGQPEPAEKLHNAWLTCLEDGIHTYDIFKEGVSRQKVGTKAFAKAVGERIGRKPQQLKPVSYQGQGKEKNKVDSSVSTLPKADKQLVGVDIFLDSSESLEAIHKALEQTTAGEWKLSLIANRGVTLWPSAFKYPIPPTDQWRCRFVHKEKGHVVTHKQLFTLLERISAKGLDVSSIENLYTFDGKPGGWDNGTWGK